MTTRPHILRSPQVRAALDKRLSAVIVPLREQPIGNAVRLCGEWRDERPLGYPGAGIRPLIKLPFAPGDLLWCRETWVHTGVGIWTISDAMRSPFRSLVDYRADGEQPSDKWFSASQMPRWANRLTLIVVDVQVLRVQDVSEEQARALGYEQSVLGDQGRASSQTALGHMRDEWPHDWNSNPWCALAEVTVRQGNVDALEAAE